MVTIVVSAIAIISIRNHATVFMPASLSEEIDHESEKVCVIAEPDLTEASGMSLSLQHADSIWVHNDSGDGPRLFLVGFDGNTKAVVTVNIAKPTDWEDMCSFEIDDAKWLLIGDMGDNGRVRGKSAPACQLLLLKEPKLQGLPADIGSPLRENIDVYATIEFRFPDGPADCESLAVDTKNREILLLTKSNPLKCKLFRIPLSLNPGRQTTKAENVASLAIPYATAMDVSSTNNQLAVVNMFSGVLIKRAETESWGEACQRPVTFLTLPPRPQGETVCFTSDGLSLLMNSEGARQPLWRVPLPKPTQQ